MDLGLVQSKLKGSKYSTPGEFAADVRLIWKNCMLYNQVIIPNDLCIFLMIIFGRMDLNTIFWLPNLRSYLKISLVKSRGCQTLTSTLIFYHFLNVDFYSRRPPPTLEEKTQFSRNLYVIGSEDLGKLVQILDERCDTAMDKVLLLLSM